MDVASKQQKTLKNVLYYGLPVLAILMIAVGWVLFSGSHPELMPAPADVWARFVKTFTKPIAKTSLAGHAWASLRRVLMALLIAWAFGISFGILIGWNKKCKAFFGSIFEVIRPIPPIAWIPIVIMWFGIGEFPKVLLVFIGTFVPLVINTSTGIEMVDKINLDVGHLLFHQLFMAFAVILQIPNGNEFDIPLLCQLHQLRRTHHGTILTHDFAAQPTFLQACQSA